MKTVSIYKNNITGEYRWTNSPYPFDSKHQIVAGSLAGIISSMRSSLDKGRRTLVFIDSNMPSSDKSELVKKLGDYKMKFEEKTFEVPAYHGHGNR